MIHQATLRIIVLGDPWGKWSHLPGFRMEYDAFEQAGLFKPGYQGTSAYTDLGRIAHWLARELHPLRAFYRTEAILGKCYVDVVEALPPDALKTRVRGCLDQLQALDIAEPDPKYRRGQAWRIII